MANVINQLRPTTLVSQVQPAAANTPEIIVLPQVDVGIEMDHMFISNSSESGQPKTVLVSVYHDKAGQVADSSTALIYRYAIDGGGSLQIDVPILILYPGSMWIEADTAIGATFTLYGRLV